jgi:hypothetical protein
MQPPAGLVPSTPFITIVVHEEGIGCVVVLGTWEGGEGERGREVL